MHSITRKKIGALFLILGASSGLSAQQTITTAGGNANASSGSVAYTVGQTSYKSVSSSTGLIQEGVQQPFIQFSPEAPKDLVISNYVSPNNDGSNDVWKISPLDKVAAYQVVITDQWGVVVFQKDANYANEWDATSNGQRVQDGVYYFSLLENDKVVVNGSITVLGK